MRRSSLLALMLVALSGCRRDDSAKTTITSAPVASAPTSAATMPKTTPPTPVGAREAFPFIDNPTAADIGNGPLECVYDGKRARIQSVQIDAQRDDWRKWRIELSSQPLMDSGYLPERADHLDLYLPAITPSSRTPIVFPGKGKETPAQAILRWNDFFGPHGAREPDDEDRDDSANTLREGQSYVIVFDKFEPAAHSRKPGKANLRLFISLKATSDYAKKRHPRFREPSGCRGSFEGAIVTDPYTVK